MGLHRLCAVADQTISLTITRSQTSPTTYTIKIRTLSGNGAPTNLVYADQLMNIYQLRTPRPYFDIIGGQCRLQESSRVRAVTDCATSATLVRRELFFPGWRAFVSGQHATVEEYDEIFQMVHLPEGHSNVSFMYAPPHINWAWGAMCLAFMGLVASAILGRAHRSRNGGALGQPCCAAIKPKRAD